MPPQILQLLLFGLEEAIKLTPSIMAEIQSLFSKPNPTANDWAALRARVLAKSYEDYDPAPINVTAPAAVAAPVLAPSAIPLPLVAGPAELAPEPAPTIIPGPAPLTAWSVG